MVTHVVSEDMGSNTATFTADDPIEAIKYAIAKSNEHDIDFVIVLIDGLPKLKFVDGEEVKL